MRSKTNRQPSFQVFSERSQATRRNRALLAIEGLEERQLLSTTDFVAISAPQGSPATQHIYTFNSTLSAAPTDKGAITGVTSGYTLESLSRDPMTSKYYGMGINTSGVAQVYQVNPTTLVATALGSTVNGSFTQASDGFFASGGYEYFYGNGVVFEFDANGNLITAPSTSGTIPAAQAAQINGGGNQPAYGLTTNAQTKTTNETTFTSPGTAPSQTFTTATGMTVSGVNGTTEYVTGSVNNGNTTEYDLFQLTVANGTMTKIGTLTPSFVGVAILPPVLHVSGISGNVTAGSTQSITVTADPGDGSTDTAYNGTIHFTSSDGQAVLPANATLTNGTGTFNVTFKTAGTQSITATDTTNTIDTGTEGGITVTPAATSQYVVTGATAATAGGVEAVTVKAEDAYGNVATAYTGTTKITSSDGQAVLPANATLTNGVGTFNVTLKTAGTQSITATDTATPSITGAQSGIVVTAAAASHFTVSGPATATAGTAGSYTVTAYDPYANTATGYTGTVHLGSSDTQATLPANATLTNGVGTFNVTLKTAGTQSITATDTTTPSINGTQTGISVAAAALNHLVLTLPTSDTAGTAQTLTITGQDAYGNVTTTNNDTINLTTTDAQATLPASVTLAAGTASVMFTPKTAGSQAVTATDAAMTAVHNSATETVNAAAATVLQVAGAAGGVAGTVEMFGVNALDAYGNAATSYSGTVHFTSSDPHATLPANATLSNGTGSFMATLVKAGSASLSATDTSTASLTGTQSSITITPAAAASLMISGPATVVSGASPSETITAFDPYGNIATGDNGTVNLSSGDPIAQLPASVTLSNGLATFAATLNTVGSQTIQATSSTASSVSGTAATMVSPDISGTVFLDINGNGVQDAGESGLAGRVLYLDLTGSGVYASSDPTTTTDANGHFAFPGVAAGADVVRANLSQDTSDRYIVTQTTTNADANATLNIADVPFSALAPVPVLPNPFTNNPGTTVTERYVESLYRTVLGRTGSPAEVAGWVSKLNNGASSSTVANGFINSLEHRIDEVDTYYSSFLHRAADSTAMHWVNMLQAGVSEQQVVNAFLSSTEYQSEHSDADSYVRNLYLDVLGRQGSDANVAVWESALASGKSRQAVAASFVASDEASDQVIESLYLASLHRQPDSGAMNSFATKISQGVSIGKITVAILSSDEFITKSENSTSN